MEVIIAAAITAVATLIGAAATYSYTIKSIRDKIDIGINNDSQLIKEQGNLSKEHYNLSKEQGNLSKEHGNLSKEHALLLNSQSTISSDIEKVYKGVGGLSKDIVEISKSINNEKTKSEFRYNNLTDKQKEIYSAGQTMKDAFNEFKSLIDTNNSLKEKLSKIEIDLAILKSENVNLKEENINLKEKLSAASLENDVKPKINRPKPRSL